MLRKTDYNTPYINHYKRREIRSSAQTFGTHSLNNKPKLNINKYKTNHTYNKQKPLQDKQKISFKGFTVEFIPANLSRFMFKTLSVLSDEQKTLYTKYIADFNKAAKTKEAFRKFIGLSADIASTISNENLIKLPQKPLILKFASVLVSPITVIKDLALKTVDNKLGKKFLPVIYKNIQKRKEYSKIVENYKNIVGLSNFIRIQENLYRINAGHAPIQNAGNFLIPADILKEKINFLRFKSVNPEKGQYSTKNMLLTTRIVSGSVYTAFLSNDAYNTTMRYSNSENDSQEQRRARANQEIAKIGMNIYIQNMLLSTFENQINKSMTNALLASGITVAASEIIGRMLVGRPIFPSNKENLDRMEENMQNKKGVLAAIGRLIAGDKRNKFVKTEPVVFNEPQKPLIIEENNFFQNNISDFSSNSDFFKKKDLVSFKGLAKVPYMFERKYLKNMLEFIQQLDPNQGKNINEVLEKSLQGLKQFSSHNFEKISLPELLSNNSIKFIPVGTTETIFQRFVNGILSPIFFVSKLVKSSASSIKKAVIPIEEEMAKSKNKIEFKKYLEARLQLPVWKTSPLSPTEKEVKLYKEFVSRMNNSKLEVNGIKNLILTLEKRFKILKINPESPSYDDIVKAKKILSDIVTKADGANHAEYDGNKIAQLNINLSRAISTIFLVTDAYNLTIQYSNNDKREAVKSAKSRALQEASRIASSAYILAFTHSLVSKIYNGSLLGAAITVLFTSTASDALARAVVGVPIFRKSHDELLQIEQEQHKTKSPVQKALAYLIGKKVS